jgi:filamentous hemagglutinin
MRNELAFPGTLGHAEAGEPSAHAALASIANDAALNRPAAASPLQPPTPGFVTYADDEASLVHAMRAAGASRSQIEAALKNLRDQRPLSVLELVRRAPRQPTLRAAINMAHTLDGEVRRSRSGALFAAGGHYARSRNIEIVEITRRRDQNGVFEARIRIRDPRTGRFVFKRARSTFFPEHWSRRRVQMEIESAWDNSQPIGGGMWQGRSSSGLSIRGFYQSPQGDAATAWPVHEDRR